MVIISKKKHILHRRMAYILDQWKNNVQHKIELWESGETPDSTAAASRHKIDVIVGGL